jgi:hypothetical protein
MADREALIARKQAVRSEIERTRRELSLLRAPEQTGANTKRIAQLENQLDRLMGEEYQLRLAIDRAR